MFNPLIDEGVKLLNKLVLCYYEHSDFRALIILINTKTLSSTD
jgi:hypothetical protein